MGSLVKLNDKGRKYAWAIIHIFGSGHYNLRGLNPPYPIAGKEG